MFLIERVCRDQLSPALFSFPVNSLAGITATQLSAEISEVVWIYVKVIFRDLWEFEDFHFLQNKSMTSFSNVSAHSFSAHAYDLNHV